MIAKEMRQRARQYRSMPNVIVVAQANKALLEGAMPIDWAAKVRDAITNLEIDTGRVLKPTKALAIIDDVVAGKFAAAELATIHGIPQDWIETTLGHVTRAVGTGRVGSLAAGGWYAFQGYEHPYAVAPGFVTAWKQARGLS
jgi:hypothetical protein